MASGFKHRERVEFADTDMAGIMHFANFFRFMERAEHAFLRSLGSSVHVREGDRTIGWPRVHAECDYRRPLRFDDEVEVQVRVREKGEKSLTYDFTFWKLGDSPEEVAAGSVTAVCVEVDCATGSLRSVPIPMALSEQIETYGPVGGSTPQPQELEIRNAE